MKAFMFSLGAAAFVTAVAFTCQAEAEWLQPVSVADPTNLPGGGNGDSWGPIITPDGRFVVFSSRANNLLSLDGSNALPAHIPVSLNVFMRDWTNGTTVLISVNKEGNAGGSGDSLPDGVSDDGRYVVFESLADDLADIDTNGVTDVFVRDLENGTTELVSVATNGASADAESTSATMTPDGRYVAFVSSATNLVSGDSNRIPDIFVRDMQTKTTTLVSAGATSASARQGSSESPVISTNGRYVTFYTTAEGLVPGVTSTNGEIYVRDLVDEKTAWVSTNAYSLMQAVFGSLGDPVRDLL